MNCYIFNKNLMAYIEKDLPYSTREEMREHIEECNICRTAYEKKLFIREQFNDVFQNDQLAFTSVKAQVMNNIKNLEHKVSWYEKLYIHFRRYAGSYAAAAVMAIFVIIVVPRMGGMAKNDTKNIAENTSSDKASLNDGKATTTTGSDASSNELKGDNAALNKALSDIKRKELGVGPWKTIFANNNRIYFYNYSHMLVCDNSAEKQGITGAVDLIKLDLGSYQGSSLAEFLPSSNGDFCIIANFNAELDQINNKKPIYMYNAKNNSLQAIGQENMALIRTAWSNSSQYFVYGVIKGDDVAIFDTNTMASKQVHFNKGEIKKVFIDDNGDVLIDSNKLYLLRKENSYKAEELNIGGEALGFNNNLVIYFEKGSIYKYDSKGSVEINKLGINYILSKQDEKNIIFASNENFKVYDIKNNELYDYSNKYLNTSKNFSPDLKKFINNYGSSVTIIESNGTVNEIAGTGVPFDYYWLNNNTLIRVPFKENAKYLGDFIIETVDIKTGDISPIYEMK